MANKGVTTRKGWTVGSFVVQNQSARKVNQTVRKATKKGKKK